MIVENMVDTVGIGVVLITIDYFWMELKWFQKELEVVVLEWKVLERSR